MHHQSGLGANSEWFSKGVFGEALVLALDVSADGVVSGALEVWTVGSVISPISLCFKTICS